MPKGAKKKQPTAFVLYAPGGGLLSLISILTAERIEHYTETLSADLYDGIEAVSGGTFLAAGINARIPAKRIGELFVQYAPILCPYIPGRKAKMTMRQGINNGKTFFNLEAEKSDRIVISDLQRLCKKMRTKNSSADLSLIAKLEREVCRDWLSKRQYKNIINLLGQIENQDEGLKKYTQAVAERLSDRSITSSLTRIFKCASTHVMDGIKDKFAPEHECFFPEEGKLRLRELLGEMRISDSVVSTSISAYDVINNRMVSFSCLKDDIRNKDRGAPAKISNDLAYWDAIMAATSNEFGWKAHITETNLLCVDKAPFHRPKLLRDILAKEPADTEAVLVIAGTGKHRSNDLNTFLAQEDDEDGLTEDQRYRKKLEAIRDERAKRGIIGSIIFMYEIPELEAYTMSDALEDYGARIGPKNIYEFNARLSPHPGEDIEQFPSKDVLDADERNIQKIVAVAKRYVTKEDDKIRQISQRLIDNMYETGRMAPDKYVRACKKIGLKTVNLEEEINRQTQGIEDRIASNDNSTGIRRIINELTRRWIGTGTDGPPIGPIAPDSSDRPPPPDKPSGP